MSEKKKLSERHICTQFITSALQRTRWDFATQVREEVTFTNGRVCVRGKLRTQTPMPRGNFETIPMSNKRSIESCVYLLLEIPCPGLMKIAGAFFESLSLIDGSGTGESPLRGGDCSEKFSGFSSQKAPLSRLGFLLSGVRAATL